MLHPVYSCVWNWQDIDIKNDISFQQLLIIPNPEISLTFNVSVAVNYKDVKMKKNLIKLLPTKTTIW